MENIVSKIKYISRNMMFAHNKAIQKFDVKKIGIGKLPILRMILENPGICADDIAKALELDKTTVALSIKKLIGLGLVLKELNKSDKRKRNLYPTQKLIKVGNCAKLVADENVKMLLDGFDENDLDRLDGYLLRIKSNLIKYKNFQGEQNG